MSKIAVIGLSLALFATAACGSSDSGDESASTKVAAPSALKVELLDGGAHVTWKDNSDNESEFMVERKTSSTAWSTVASVPFDTTQYHDAALTGGTTYLYRVMAMPKGGSHSDGAYSAEVEFDVPGAGGAAGSGS